MQEITKYRVHTATKERVNGKIVGQLIGYQEFISLPEAQKFANGAKIETIVENCATDDVFLPKPEENK